MRSYSRITQIGGENVVFSACVIGDHDVIFCDSEIMLSRCGRVAVLLRQLIREILFFLSARLVIFTHFALLGSIHHVKRGDKNNL